MMSKPCRLAERLKEAGYRLTAPRQAIIQVLETEGKHLNPAEVLEQGQVLYPALSRATVYRTLELLTELGLIRPLYLGDIGQRFTMAEGGHHHLVCSSCGQVTEFQKCSVDTLEKSLGERFHFQISGHLLEFYGLCEQCQADQFL
jgi:Fur family ferric uptake transcriptional regulator